MAESRRDYYEVLGVARDADAKAIKDAFRALALKYHPDRNKAPDAEARFKEIAEAYAVLSDPAKRAEYDARGHAGVAGFSAEDLFGGIDFEDLLSGFGLGPGADIFARFFGGRGRRGPAPGEDLQIRLVVPLERILTGGEEMVRYPRPVTCPTCHGSGAKPGTEPRACPDCGGSGRKVVSRKEGGVSFQQITPCPRCQGRGRIIDHPCPTCGGRGVVDKEERIEVRIPPGAEEGMALRIPGKGLPSADAGGAAGDLYVVIQTLPDPRFERLGADLGRTEMIGVAEASLGTMLRVPTLEGAVDVSVPPGTQPDAVLRLRGKGLPVFGSKGRGDMLVRVQVRVPERLSPKERKLYEELLALGRRG